MGAACEGLWCPELKGVRGLCQWLLWSRAAPLQGTWVGLPHARPVPFSPVFLQHLGSFLAFGHFSTLLLKGAGQVLILGKF